MAGALAQKETERLTDWSKSLEAQAEAMDADRARVAEIEAAAVAETARVRDIAERLRAVAAEV